VSKLPTAPGHLEQMKGLGSPGLIGAL